MLNLVITKEFCQEGCRCKRARSLIVPLEAYRLMPRREEDLLSSTHLFWSKKSRRAPTQKRALAVLELVSYLMRKQREGFHVECEYIDGRAYYRIKPEAIAQRFGCSVKSIQRAILYLRECGFVVLRVRRTKVQDEFGYFRYRSKLWLALRKHVIFDYFTKDKDRCHKLKDAQIIKRHGLRGLLLAALDKDKYRHVFYPPKTTCKVTRRYQEVLNSHWRSVYIRRRKCPVFGRSSTSPSPSGREGDVEGLGKEEIFKFKEPCIRAMRCRMSQNVTLDKRDRDLTLKLAALWLANRGTDDRGWLFRLAKDYVPKIKAQVKDDWAVNEVYRRLISAFENFMKYTESRNLKTFFENWQRYLEVPKAAKEANAWRDEEEIERQRYLEKERQERRRIIEMQLRYGEWWDIESVEQDVPYVNHRGEIKPLSDVSLARYYRWLGQVKANGGRLPKWGRRDEDAELTEAPVAGPKIEYKPQQRPPEAEKAEAPAKLNIKYIRAQPAPVVQKPQQPSPVARKSHRHDMMEEKIRQGAERLKSYEIIVDESLGSRARISPRVRLPEGLVIPLRSYDSYAYTAWLNQNSDEIAAETISGYTEMSEQEKTKALFAKAKQLISGIGSWTSRGTDSQSAPASSE